MNKTKLSIVGFLALAVLLFATGAAQAVVTINSTSVTGSEALTLNGAVGSAVTIAGATTTGNIAMGGALISGTLTLGNAAQTGVTVINGSTDGANTIFNSVVGGTIAIGVANTGGINIGAGNTAKTITIGNAVTTGTTNIKAGSGGILLTSADDNSLAVGPNGATTPIFQVDSSTGSAVAGLKLTGAVTGGTVALVAIDSGANTSLTINAKGTGTIGIGSVSAGAVTITPATTIAGALTTSAGISNTGDIASTATVTTPAVRSASTGDVALIVNASGTGTIGIGSTSTGAVTITPATTITGALTTSAGIANTGDVASTATVTTPAVRSASSGDVALIVNASGTGTIGIGSTSTGAVTITPATTITGALTANGGITVPNLKLVDLSAITNATAASQGLILPNVGAAPTDPTVATEGFIGWDQTNNLLLVNTGAAWDSVFNNTASANTWTGANIFAPTTITDVVTIGKVDQTGTITLGLSTAGQTIDVGSAVIATTKTQNINIGNGATVGTNNISIGGGATATGGVDVINIGTGATVDGTKTIHIGDGDSTGTGVTAITIGSNANIANTTLIKGGSGATAITLTPQTTGAIVIGAAAGTGAITIGSSSAGQTVNVGSGNVTGSDIVNVGTGTATVKKTVNVATGAISDVNIGTGNFVNTIKIGDDATPLNVITIGGAASKITINTDSWDVSNTGAITGLTGLTVVSGTVALPAGEIGTAELANAAVTSAKLDEGTIKFAEVSLSNAQIKALTTAVEVVAAPGAGKVISFVDAIVIHDVGSADFATAHNVTINYKADGAGAAVSTTLANPFISGSAVDKISTLKQLATDLTTATKADWENQPLTIKASANPITGDGVGRVKVWYRVFSTGL